MDAKKHYRKMVALRLLEWRLKKEVPQEEVAQVLDI